MKIEKGINFPAQRTSWPFVDMKIGDSFRVPSDLRPRIHAAASCWGKRHGSKFSVRTTPDETRCWRIA